MNARFAEIRDTLLLSAAVIVGVLVPPAFAIIGLPLAAAGVAGLAYRGRIANAAFSVALGVAGVALINAVDVIYVAPALALILLAVVALPRIDVQWIGALLIGVLTVADAIHEYVLMQALHETPRGLVDQVVSSMSSGSSTNAATAQANRQTVDLLVQLLPMAYFITAFVTGIAIILAIVWAAKRTGRTLKVPPLSKLDLTPHVLWPFIVGVLAVAASYASWPYSSLLWMIGLNLLLGARALFALQGFGVSAGVLERTGVGLGVRIFALAALAALDVFTFAVSFIGLIDFWVNFRRLPRDGATPPSPTTAVSDR